MSSIIEIYNLALGNIRAGYVNSLSESSAQVQQCNLRYPILRDRMLKEHWGFNNKIQALAVLTDDIYTWAYAYQYPTDCLKIDRLVGEYESLANADADVLSRLVENQLLPTTQTMPPIPYEVFNIDGNKVIGANEANVRAKYAVKITDTTKFSDDFVMALSHLLASEIAVPLIGGELGRQLRSDELQLYKEYVNAAAADDANESDADEQLSEYETIRR